MGAAVFSSIATDALLVETVSVEELSLWFAVSAGLRVFGALAYGALARRFRQSAWFDAAFVGIVGLTEIACGLATDHVGILAVVGIVVVQTLGPPLLPLIAFIHATDSLDTRRAKHLLPIVAAASTIGTVVAGLVSHFVAPRLGAPSLLVIGGLLACSAVPFLRRATAAPSSIRPEERGSLRGFVRELRSIPAVRLLLIAACLGAFLSNVADFGLKADLQASYGVDRIASYLGLVNAGINALVLLLQLAFTGRIVARYGVGAALLVGPLIMGAAAPLLFVLPVVAGTTLVRVADQVFRYGIGNAAADLLVVPVPTAVRARAKLVAKAVASPLGALASSVVLTLIVRSDDRRAALVVVLVAGAVAMLALLRGARAAYAHALELALGRGIAPVDVSAEAVSLYRAETLQRLADASRAKDATATKRILEIMTERLFVPGDVAAAARSGDPEIELAAVRAAIRLAKPDEGDLLLSTIPRLASDEAESTLIEGAIARGGKLDEPRLLRGLGRREQAQTDAGAARHFAVAMVAKARREESAGEAERPAFFATVKTLRKLALENDSPLRAAALSALRQLDQKQVTREVQLALSSAHPAVFYEAARAGLSLGVQGTTALLVARLCTGPLPGVASRALAGAGMFVMRELLEALPTTRGEGTIQPTAIASSRTVTGSVRAARALARLGKNAVAEVLPHLPSLGFRARASLAHAIGAARLERSDRNDALVVSAMELFIDYGSFVAARETAATAGGLYRRELTMRRLACVEAVLDLACVRTDRLTISRARVALEAGGARRETALELLENVVPSSIAQRVVALAEGKADPDGVPAEKTALPAPEGWLLLCLRYDGASLSPTDPMASVFDRIAVLKDVALFAKLTAEELYPIAEIARDDLFAEGVEIVRQGDPADDLFVVMSGTCEIERDGARIGSASAGQAFGELGVLDGEPRAATVRAATETRLLRIPRVEFEALVDESPELARGIIAVLLGYLREKKG